MAHPRHTAEITFVAYWDTDERGEFPEVEVLVSPEWMSSETVRKIEADIASNMQKVKRERRSS